MISAALFARFASRDEINFAAKVAAALRNQFGGHAIKAMAKAEAHSEDPRTDGRTTNPAEENPLLEGLSLRRTPDPCALVIFGASGDLTHKKLMPALYALMLRRLLPPRFAIVGVARTEGDDDAFREDMKDAVQKHARDEFREDVWDELAESMHYIATDFADEGGEHEARQAAREARQGARPRRQPRLLPRRSARRVPDDRRRARQAAHARRAGRA